MTEFDCTYPIVDGRNFWRLSFSYFGQKIVYILVMFTQRIIGRLNHALLGVVSLRGVLRVYLLNIVKYFNTNIIFYAMWLCVGAYGCLFGKLKNSLAFICVSRQNFFWIWSEGLHPSEGFKPNRPKDHRPRDEVKHKKRRPPEFVYFSLLMLYRLQRSSHSFLYFLIFHGVQK